MYLLDLWRRQTASDKWVESFCDLVKQWSRWDGPPRRARSRQVLDRSLTAAARAASVLRARNLPDARRQGVRAQSIRGRMALEGLYVPTNKPWYPDFRSELLAFPAGKHDDCVDALGLVGQLLDKMLVGTKLAGDIKRPPRDKYARARDRAEHQEVTWLTV